MIQASKRLANVKRIFDPYKDRRGLVRLDRNEDPVGWSQEHFSAWLASLDPYDIAAYADSGELCSRLSVWLGVPKESIYITAGSDAAIKNIFESFVDPGDRVLTQSPSWSMYDVYSSIYQAQLDKAAFDSNLDFDVEGFCAQLETPGLRMVLLANPNQPTGTALEVSQLEKIIDIAKAKNVLVVIDEAYHLFTPKTAISSLGQHNNLIITRTFSKAFGLAGLRIGYAVSCPERIADLMLLRPVTDSNSLAISCATYLMDHYDWVESRLEDVVSGREYLFEKLQESGLRCYPSETNFLLIRYPELEFAVSAVKGALEKGYSLKGPFTFSPLENCIRISIGPLALMQKFWADCSDILKRTNVD